MKKIIISGSARGDGDTIRMVNELARQLSCDAIDLNDYHFGYYDYEHINRNDDFLPLMRKIISSYDLLIFATPVYWYSMSGIMKVFFDRITDLLTIEKDLGRQLRGKYMAAISCSNGNNLEDNFWLPFSNSAEYLGMKYLGDMHTFSGEDLKPKIADFIEIISNE
ncbi:MAG: flavodoxin family protein [Candidatus Cyclobacteriaceae bacterium M3_2C_046]